MDEFWDKDYVLDIKRVVLLPPDQRRQVIRQHVAAMNQAAKESRVSLVEFICSDPKPQK